jgi:hypothetical protein
MLLAAGLYLCKTNPMKHYLVSYIVTSKDGKEIYVADVVPVESKVPASIKQIREYFDEYFAEPGICHLTNVQSITNEEYIQYGGEVSLEQPYNYFAMIKSAKL